MRGPPSILAHPSRGSWPHREPHRRPQRQGPHAGTATHFGTTAHEGRGPTGNSTEGHSGRVRMRGPPHILAHLTQVVAPHGAPPKALAA
eukprot:3948587-Pyramimonas_sp.AAC.1